MLSDEQRIDKVQQKLLNQEQIRCYKILERLFSVVQFLAERNIAFQESVEKLGDARNGNYICIIELLGKFDPIMQRIVRKTTNEHHLSKTIQNEIINVRGIKIRNKIIEQIKKGKYFAVILDCTPDISHKEQMSLSLRYVTDGTLPGVQARILKENSRAFFTSCTRHNYNLLLGDIAKICLEAITFFGILQRLYVLFSVFTKRWLVLLKYVKELTVKPICDSRWECRIQSAKAVRFQIGEFCDTLFEVSETSKNPQIKSEAELLGNLMKDYKFFGILDSLLSKLYLKKKKKEELKKHALDLEIALTDSKIIQTDTSNDTVKPEAYLEGNMLLEKIETLKSILSSEYSQNPYKMFQFLSENDRATAFSNLFIALRVNLTIPVSVASGERSFSRGFISKYNNDAENFFPQFYGLLYENLLPSKFDYILLTNTLLTEVRNHILRDLSESKHNNSSNSKISSSYLFSDKE
nr:uncharacterized protein LOC124812505 [Hydra vulgaris]